MKKNLLKLFLIVSLATFLTIPIKVFAVPSTPSNAGVSTLGDLILKIHGLLNAIVPVLIALGVVYFVWGVVMYVIADGEEAKKKGRDRMIFGVIGLAVIIGVWGFVFMVTNTFNLQQPGPTKEQIQKLLPGSQ